MLNCCFFNKPLATILLMSASMSPIYAAEESRSRPPNGVTNFITDSGADISLRNQFKNLNSSDYGERSVQTAWGQGVTLDFRSGYIADIIGFDTSYYQVFKLAASDDFAGRSVLYNDNGKAKGFHKFGLLYAKLKLDGEDSYFRLYSGWQIINK